MHFFVDLHVECMPIFFFFKNKKMMLKLKLVKVMLKIYFFNKWCYFCQSFFTWFFLLSRWATIKELLSLDFAWAKVNSFEFSRLVANTFFFSHFIHFLSNPHSSTIIFLPILCSWLIVHHSSMISYHFILHFLNFMVIFLHPLRFHWI